ncbi:hypothetical protein BG005_007710 [Podila minutissima]|nr:hypothetical protein BG005_007710 [Podila minutissima]
MFMSEFFEEDSDTALAIIEKNLNSAAAIEFLFLTGCLFKDLLDTLAKNIANEFHAGIAKKYFKDAHTDHPEFAELMRELCNAYCSLCEA